MAASSRTSLRVDRLRALNRPQPVEVELDGRGVPTTIVLKQAGDGGRCPAATLPPRAMEADEKRWCVEMVGEVWRVDDEWWRQPISRRYVEVVLEGGKHTVVFQDLTNGNWFIQSI